MAIVPIKQIQMSQQEAINETAVSSSELNQASKKALRRDLIARRLALSSEQKQLRSEQLSQELLAWLAECVEQTATIAMYWAFKGEVDLQPLMDLWRAQGGKVLLPIVQAVNQPLAFAPYRGITSMQQGAYGILEPIYEEDELIFLPDMAALITPCVGFNSAGYRLGYGGGYYDRTLAFWQSEGLNLPVVLGVADQSAQVDFAVETFDRPMNFLALTDS